MTTVTVSSTADAWIGPTRATSTADAIIAKLGNLKTSTADAYLKRRLTSTADAIIADNRGSFRGSGRVAGRDALTNLYAGDTYQVMDDADGQPMHYFDGTNWSSQSSLQVPESGQARTRRSPTAASAGIATVGDVTYPFLLNAGLSRLFSVDASGHLYTNSETFGAASTLNVNDTVTLPETVTYQTPARVQGTSGTVSGSTTIGASWPSSTTAGNMLWVIVFVEVPGIATPPVGYTLAFSQTGAGGVLGIYAYYLLNCGAGAANPSITFSGSRNASIVIEEYSGVATVAALDQTATASRAESSSAVPSVIHGVSGTMTTQATELWLGGYGTDAGTSEAITLSDPTPGFSLLAHPVGTGYGGTQLYVADAAVRSAGIPLFSLRETITTAHAKWTMGIATFKAATTTTPNPAANSATLYVADYNGVSAYYYRDDAGVDHRLTDAAALAVVAADVAIESNSAVLNLMSYYATRIRFLERALGIDYSSRDILRPDEADSVDELEL